MWLATASLDAVPHLVPFSLGWTGSEIHVATPAATATARNVVATGRARASLDDADDVVLIDGSARVEPLATVDSAVLAAFVDRVGWNPATEPGDWVLIVFTPDRALSWNGLDETTGRVIMRNGSWLA